VAILGRIHASVVSLVAEPLHSLLVCLVKDLSFRSNSSDSDNVELDIRSLKLDELRHEELDTETDVFPVLFLPVFAGDVFPSLEHGSVVILVTSQELGDKVGSHSGDLGDVAHDTVKLDREFVVSALLELRDDLDGGNLTLVEEITEVEFSIEILSNIEELLDLGTSLLGLRDAVGEIGSGIIVHGSHHTLVESGGVEAEVLESLRDVSFSDSGSCSCQG